MQDSKHGASSPPPKSPRGRRQRQEPSQVDGPLRPMNMAEARLLQDAQTMFHRALMQWASDVLVMKRSGADGLRWLGASFPDVEGSDGDDDSLSRAA